MKRERERNRGFSLVELIIVVAILAVLVALLAPQYFQYVEKSRKQVCQTNIFTMTRMAVIARNLGEDTYQNLLTKALDESYPTVGKSGCPSGGAYEIKQNPSTQEWYINCTKHGAIPSFGEKFAIDAIMQVMADTKKGTLDSEAAKYDPASSKVITARLKDEGYDLEAMGAVSWQYNEKSGGKSILWWSTEDISTKKPDDKMYIIQYRQDSGNYTVWKTTVKEKTQTSISDEPYNVFSDQEPYKPSTTHPELQTYEDALRLLKQAQEEMKK